ncbi:MAG: hypothetical protein RIR26_442, partial [Pseudomonadota bacterium]
MGFSKNKQSNSAPWTKQVLEYFDNNSLEESKKEALRRRLLQAELPSKNSNLTYRDTRITKSPWASSLISAAVAATLTFLIV